MTWSEFAEAAPELARLAEERFERTGLVLLGTLRADGWPRISPVEPLVFRDHLIIGGTWGTLKTRDLLRDPRCVVSTIVRDKDDREGEVKLVGRANEVTNTALLEGLDQNTFEQLAFRPGPRTYRRFWMDVHSAAFIQYMGDLTSVLKTWHEGEPVRERRRRWTTNGYVDLP